MKIAILDDYQDAVRGLDCFQLLDGHEVKVFSNTARGLGQLAIRLAPFDALVLIRERSSFNRALLSKLPNLKLISQTGKVSGHIDVAAATELGIAAVAVGLGLPEVRQHIGIGPAAAAHLRPDVEIRRIAADIQHAVDG